MERKLPEGWEWKRLGDVAELIMGQSPPGDTYNEIDQGMPFLQGKSEFGDISPEHVKYTTKPLKIAPTGSVLMSVRAPVGDVNIAGIDYCIGRGLASLSLHEGENVFLFYVLNYFKNKIEKRGTGSTFKAITKSKLHEFKIPLPPLETQRKIVAILEKAEETKRLRMHADELADRLLQSVFLEMFGDPAKNLKGWDKGYLGDFFSGVRYGVSIKSSMKGYPIIGMGSISYDGRIDWNNLPKVDISPDVFQKEMLKKYDLLFNRTNASDLVGKTGIVTKEIDAVAASYLIRLRIKPSHNPYFVWGLMNSPYFKAMFRQRCKKAVNQANINSKELAAFPALFPHPPLQQKFAQIVEKVEAMRQNQKQSRQEIDNLFNALMQKAFNGELTT